MKTEVAVAIISGTVAVVSAGIAYRADKSITALDQSFTSKHERGMETLRAELTSRHEREMTLLRTQLTQQHERQLPFLKRQMKLYFEAVETASSIANRQDVTDTSELETRFWELYWGALAVVEDQTVINAMVQFGNELSSTPRKHDTLKRRSIALAHACRDSLQDLWNVDLGKLEDPRAKQ